MHSLHAIRPIVGLVSAACLAGCISSPLPAGTEAQLYAWQETSTPLARRTGIVSTDYNGYFDGDFDFSNLPLQTASANLEPDTPYVLKSCEAEACYYAVLFPGDFSLKDDGLLGGFAALTPLSTAMYADVSALAATQVRPRLDALAAAVTTPDGPRDYAGFVKLDYERSAQDAARIEKLDVNNAAEAAIRDGELPSLQALLNASITTTGELQASADFIFSSAWDLEIDVNVTERMPNAYLALCADFDDQDGERYEVNYANCRLKTPTRDGVFEDTLRMSASVDQMVAVLFPLDNPGAREFYRWERSVQGTRFEVR